MTTMMIILTIIKIITGESDMVNHLKRVRMKRGTTRYKK